MSTIIENITVKNFLSIGAITQTVKFDEKLTLILGSNMDLGGDSAGNRNGVGKTTILNAVSYALYGQAIASIKKENLINTINGKQMLVTIDFKKSGKSYRIERGRRPNVLKFYVDNKLQTNTDSDDDSQGDSRETQKAIEQLIGMSNTMFKHLVALNTYTQPFLAMRVADQREVIEQLLGVTLLSEKAELLKVQIKEGKDKITEEQFRIEAIKNANENVNKTITSLGMKSKLWDKTKTESLQKLNSAVANLEKLDIESEIALHHALKEWTSADSALTELKAVRKVTEKSLVQNVKSLTKLQESMASLLEHRCPTCSQGIHDEKHQQLIDKASEEIQTTDSLVNTLTQELAEVITALDSFPPLSKKPVTYYDLLSEALEHRSNLSHLNNTLSEKVAQLNPYDEQITELQKTAIQEISWDSINALSKTKDHQEFLLRLLTNKDSFIRKKIIDQNLGYLNARLAYYTDKMGLPHTVVFQNDLSVTITQLGQDLDYENLSRGEMNRLILSLSLSFRDVWESLYDSINLLFIDEILDSGLDSSGVESGLSLLKKLARDRNKNVYLISHREELIGRVDSILRVVKENGFTTFVNSEDTIVKA